MNTDLCQTLALGALIKGYFHNLKGSIQSLSLQLQILYMKKDTYLTPQAQQTLEKALQALQKLQTQLDVALGEINNDNSGPWDLKEIMEKELLFWEANLHFKHKVTKEIVAETETKLTIPLNLLRGSLCLIEEVLYPSLPENSHLKIIITKTPLPTITFQLSPPLKEEVVTKLKERSEYINLFELKVTPQEVSFIFQTNG